MIEKRTKKLAVEEEEEEKKTKKKKYRDDAPLMPTILPFKLLERIVI